MTSMGTRRSPRALSSAEFSAPTSPIRAARPRPSRERCASSAMLKLHLPAPARVIVGRKIDQTRYGIYSSCGGERPFALDDLRRELEVGLAAAALQVIEQKRLCGAPGRGGAAGGRGE